VEAAALIDSLRQEFPDSVGVHGQEGVIAARLGDTEKALRISDELDAINRPYLFGNPTGWRARIAAVLGDREQAVSLLRETYERGFPFGTWLLHERDLDSLRNYPPFQEWIRPKG